MKIIIDENVAFALEAFGKFGEVILSPGRKISNKLLRDADALIVRSITTVDKNLLDNTSVKYVGTATIGTDHVDINYLNELGITFSDAKGCNSFAVAEYFMTGLLAIANKYNRNLENLSIGIVGYGNVGKKTAVLAEALGLKVFVSDPPLEREGFFYPFSSLSKVLACDIVTLHVPMNIGGIDNTYHLINKTNIDLLKEDVIFFNTSRGAVVENEVLLKKLTDNKKMSAVLDVWENEPNCNNKLVKKVKIGTPHIAGYSFEGKVIGTKMIYDSFCDCFGFNKEWQYDLYNKILKRYTFDNGDSFENNFYKITNSIYNIYKDGLEFKKILELDKAEQPKYFDDLRKNYNLRMEFPNYEILVDKINTDNNIFKKINQLRFKIADK
ncbi:MAG: 4-phosphoerythronate dehydrogenase [bacterium]